jgi:hypothetical protein
MAAQVRNILDTPSYTLRREHGDPRKLNPQSKGTELGGPEDTGREIGAPNHD